MLLTPCGISCEICPLEQKCEGCRPTGGKPFYIDNFDADVCPIYDCSVNKNGYETCAECQQLPCQMFFDWKDPDMTDEEHRQAVESNVARLKKKA